MGEYLYASVVDSSSSANQAVATLRAFTSRPVIAVQCVVIVRIADSGVLVPSAGV